MNHWLLETFLGSTLLMLVVLALRAPVARAFGARWAYALWLVPAMRLVLPPLPDFLPKAPIPPVVIFIPTTADLTAPSPTITAMSGEWMPFFLALWAGGAVIFLTLQWLAYRDFLHRLEASARPARPPAYGGIAILVSPEVEGPVALGLLHRKIVVPADFLRRYSACEQRLAMEHELIHHRRGDMWWNLAALVALALNWFSPIAWLAFRAFRSDQELACDAVVAARASIDERHDYASALVKSATHPGLIAACPLTRAGQLKHRLRMMRSHRISRLRSFGGGTAISLLALGALALSPGFSQPQEPPIVYVAAAATAPAQISARPAAPLALAQAATPAVPRKGRASGRHAAASQAAPDPLVLAATTPVALPEPKFPALAQASLPDINRLTFRTRPTRVLRVASAPHAAVQVYTAAIASGDDDDVRDRLDLVAALIARLNDADLSDRDLQSLKAALERAQGHIKVKVMQTVIRENGA